MSYWQAQGRPDNAYEPDAPWNRSETVGELIVCEECGGEVHDPKEYAGNWCDKCLVINAKKCGDWDDESLAARERLNRN